MSVSDRGVIDTLTFDPDGTPVLYIFDHLQWDCGIRYRHANMLKDKINDYLQFIESGQIAEHLKCEEYSRVVIRIDAKYSYSRYCLDFLERCKKQIKENGSICELEWIHMPSEENSNTEFNDGFSDDHVFEPDKIYPRLKKNWSKKPLEEVTIMAPYGNFYDDPKDDPEFNNFPMFRIMDSYVIFLMQDVGSTYAYLGYDNIPEGVSVEQLEQKAFDNLHRDVTYRMNESKEPGVYGILAGGDFEAESLCLPGIWEDCSDDLNDDLLIAVPTKDLVFFTKAGDKKAVRKMLDLARNAFESNRSESPYLIFSRDVFYYDRSAKRLEISKKYTI